MICEHDENIEEEKRLLRLYNSREAVCSGFQNIWVMSFVRVT